MRTAYLDAFSGLSGDMMVGALLDCGADFAELERAVASIPITGYRLSHRRRVLSGISAVKFEVEVIERQPERRFGEIRAMIESAAALDEPARNRAIAIFQALADAEAKIHDTTADEVHFHEVGAVDSIIDIVGAAWGLGQLEVGDVIVSPLPAGSGFTRSQHGIIPVPAPATAELLAGFPVRIGDGAAEMVTPTGAAVLKAIARPGALPLTFEIEKIGYGAGSRTLADRPNVLRLMLGREHSAFESDEMLEIAANIDDLNPQIYDHVMERLFGAGARDVTITPTLMKKGRPAVTLGVIAEAADRDKLARIIFDETSTIGLRFHPISRLKLHREIKEVETRFGKIRVKVSGAEPPPHPHPHAYHHSHQQVTISPEYDDCRHAAITHGVALRIVMEEARAAAQAKFG
ncbi:MAG TPA: nickel pincer cofactor biosynthesis protein LarC [Candidatus Binataceae bacterium]|nr:nickel pincer cofactor biosynthesis protein LarC [Candidatus Binataceae bacterium]